MSKELLDITIQAVEYLKEAGINKPHFIKHAEEVIKAAKADKEVGLTPEQKTYKHFDSYLSANNNGMTYPKIQEALKKALKKNPEMLVDEVEVDCGGEFEIRMETIALIEDLEYSITVKKFCEMCGIEN